MKIHLSVDVEPDNVELDELGRGMTAEDLSEVLTFIDSDVIAEAIMLQDGYRGEWFILNALILATLKVIDGNSKLLEQAYEDTWFDDRVYNAIKALLSIKE